MRQVLGAVLVIAVGLLLGSRVTTFAQPFPPIIDMHFHPLQEWDRPLLVRLFDQLGVAKAAGGTTYTQGRNFASTHPDRFIPFAGVELTWMISRAGSAGPSIWNLQSPEATAYLRLMEVWLRGGLKGIGEIHTNNVNSHVPPFPGLLYPTDSPVIRSLFALSATYRVPLQLHADAVGTTEAEIERLLESNRQGILIWAHIGRIVEPPAFRQLLQRHPNLIGELSFRDERALNARPERRGHPITRDGQLRPEWKELFEEFPDRFVFGTDVQELGSLGAYAQVIVHWRGILSQLSSETSKRIFHQNAERILNLPPVAR